MCGACALDAEADAQGAAAERPVGLWARDEMAGVLRAVANHPWRQWWYQACLCPHLEVEWLLLKATTAMAWQVLHLNQLLMVMDQPDIAAAAAAAAAAAEAKAATCWKKVAAAAAEAQPRNAVAAFVGGDVDAAEVQFANHDGQSAAAAAAAAAVAFDVMTGDALAEADHAAVAAAVD